jgi:heat shock protein HslJ
MNKKLSLSLSLLVSILILSGCQNVPVNTTDPDDTKPVPQVEPTTVTILVPSDIEEYQTQMTEYVQAGGTDPLQTTKFVKKEITIQETQDLIMASAQAAAAELKIGGPGHASVSYLKIVDKTAYVVLDIDIDGWAGVSVSIAQVHPLVEKTLLQFPEIEKVVFDNAPEELSLTTKEWEWTGANKPGLFILSFNDDTRFSAKTDCNNMGGRYTLDGNSLTFGDMYSTLMYCEGSQESEFSALLGKVTGYKLTDKGGLVLSSKTEPELMIFK